MKFTTCVLLLCAICAGAVAEEQVPPQNPALRDIEARLVKMPQMLGRFEQTKTLAQLPRPLLSSGVFALSEDHGVSWHVLKPVESHLVLSKQGKHGDALSRQLAVPLAQILTGNFSALQDLFVIDAELDGGRWIIRLEPRASQLQEFLLSIEVGGAEYIERIHLIEANNARTQIALSDLRALDKNSAELSAEFNNMQ